MLHKNFLYFKLNFAMNLKPLSRIKFINQKQNETKNQAYGMTDWEDFLEEVTFELGLEK